LLTRWRNDCTFFYILDRDKRFDDFRDRIIIDWALQLFLGIKSSRISLSSKSYRRAGSFSLSAIS
jgi:hypothetical protein